MNAATNKSAKGCEVWVYDEKSKVYTLSKNICNNLSKAINTLNRGVKISKKFKDVYENLQLDNNERYFNYLLIFLQYGG